MDSRDRLLTTEEVATVTRLPIGTVRWYRHLGTGPKGFRVGRRVMYPESAVYAWLDERAEGDELSARRTD